MAINDPTEVLAAIAEKASDLFAGGCHYPPPGADPPEPFGVVRWGTTTVSRGDARVWDLTAWVEIAVPIVNESELDLAAADPVIVRLVDRFSTPNPGAYHLATAAGEYRVNACEAVEVDPEFRRAGYYVPRVRLAVKFHRLPDSANF